MIDVILPVTGKLNQLSRGPLSNHGINQLIPTKRTPNVIPPAGLSFTGPVDVRQPLCPVPEDPDDGKARKPVPGCRTPIVNDNTVDVFLISPGRQTIVFQSQVFDRFPMAALEAVLRDRCEKFDFSNNLRNMQRQIFLPDWTSLPRIAAIKDPPRRFPLYGHIQVPNELPQKESTSLSTHQKRLHDLDTGPPQPFAEVVDVFEEFDSNGGDSDTEVTIKSSGGGAPCAD